MPLANTEYQPTTKDITAERERRIEAGQTVNVPGIGGFKVDTRNSGDKVNILGLLGKAQLRITGGDTTTTVTFTDANNISRDLTPAQVISMAEQTADKIEILHVKARILKAMDPIPQDYTNDTYWT